MAVIGTRIKGVGQAQRRGAQTAENRSFMTGENVAWIPRSLIGRVGVRPVGDVDANNSRRVEYSAPPRAGASWPYSAEWP